MDLKLSNKVAYVGGGSKGIGKGIAIKLAQEGCNLILCARNKENLEQTADLIRKDYSVDVLALAVDLSNMNEVKESVEKGLEHFKQIDILIANSGGPKPGTFFNLEDDDWASAYNSVLLYVIELYKNIIPQMKKNKWGRIINITSLSVKEPAETLLLSNVFRSGVTALAKSLSSELYEAGITINNVAPGAFKTDRAIQLMQSKADAEGKTFEEVEKELSATLPGNKFSSIDDIGNLVTFLASDLSGEVTGTTVQIDKGISKGLL